MDLLSDLAAFDGKQTDVLEALAAKRAPGPALTSELCAVAQRDEARLPAAATWLLKRFQEQGHVYAEEETAGLLGLFGSVDPWEAKLHLLQMLPGLVIPEDRAPALWRLVKGEGFLQGPNKFVRAWSYNALAVTTIFLACLSLALLGFIAPAASCGQQSPRVPWRRDRAPASGRASVG